MLYAQELRNDNTYWKNIYDFTLACGQARNPKDLAVKILKNLDGLCSFDQALVYFFDGNGKICDQYLLDIDERWSTMYLEHYFNADNQRYSCFVDIRENPKKMILSVRDWDNEPSIELVPNLIRPRGLKYSCGFVLYDLNGNYRTVIALDRLGKKNFSNDELMNLQIVIPQLNNLHKSFFYQGFSRNAIKRSVWETAKLTEREAEVADLLCMGISPANISRTLYIAPATTYKHIAHIYKKVHVSSQQELLVRLLRQLG